MEHRSESTPQSHTTALAVLVLLGPLFGIATQVWGQALLLLGLAVLLIVAPPHRAPGAIWCVLFAAIFALGLTAFLPARWLPVPEWRRALEGDFRIPLPETLSAQPWVSVHAACLLFGGLVFALYLTTHGWGPHSRRQAARWYVGGIVVLAVLALISTGVNWPVPIWPRVLNSYNAFGFFPNRNQTANVLALAGIMATALAFDAFERKRISGWFWSLAVIVLGTAIVQTVSRAGVLIFFGGIAAWVLLSYALSATRKAGGLGVAAVALLLTGFFIFGGNSFDRFHKLSEEATQDFRVVIQKDALLLAGSAPWLGQGLGNFEPVFAMSRDVSAGQNHAIHPESDWLWVAVEMGWPAAALIGAAFLLWLRQCLPLSPGSDRSLRSAALVCGVGFAIHSLGDVSGHRPGTAWPALFLAGLAMHPRRTFGKGRWAAPVFRMLGVMLALIAGWWFTSEFSGKLDRVAPTMATVAKLEAQVEQQNLQGNHPAAVVGANEALGIAPLSANFYFQRAMGRLAEGFSVWGAAWDFGTARYLQPRLSEVPFGEGKAWIEAKQPDLALDAWVEALRRAGDKGPLLYERMFRWAGDRLGMRTALAKFARTNPDYFLVYLGETDRLGCELLINQLVEAEPTLESLSRAQRKTLFQVWYTRGDRSLLLQKLLANPEWKQDGSRWLAHLYADAKDYQRACEIAAESTSRPSMPKITGNKSLEELERLFRFRPNDIDLGLQLYTQQVSLGKTKDALATLKTLQAIPGAPAYLHFIEAQLHEENEQWEQAWRAWLRVAWK